MKNKIICQNGNTVERWYDRRSRSSVTVLKDSEGYQVGSAFYSGTKVSADSVRETLIKDNGGERTAGRAYFWHDVKPHGAVAGAGSLWIKSYPDDLVDSPLWWQSKGLQETASGYGAKLHSPFKINFGGKLRRLYVTIYGNSGSTWFKSKGRKVFVH